MSGSMESRFKAELAAKKKSVGPTSGNPMEHKFKAELAAKKKSVGPTSGNPMEHKFKAELAAKKNESEEPTDDQIVEEILALGELSKATLGSYIRKASVDARDSGAAGLKLGAKPKITSKETKTSNRLMDKSDSRLKGVVKATNKLTKEQKEIIGGILEELEMEESAIIENSLNLINNIISGDSLEIDNSFETMMKEKIADRLETFRMEIAKGMFTESLEEISDDQILEDILALDELSKATLGNYLDKATFNYTKNTSRSFTQKNTADKKRAVKNRILGIANASGKLTKEQKETIEDILTD